VFPLPDAPGCVDYAIYEAAETLDAILRDKRTGDKRNNDKQPNARREWGQCGYMIASGIMQTDYELFGIGFPNGTLYDVLHYLTQEALDMDGSLVEAFQEWAAYCDYEGWDAERPDASIFGYIVALGVPTVIWGGNYFADLLPATRGWLYWSKGQDGLTMSDGELAWTTEDKPLRSKTVNRSALKGSVHPTQKPVEVIQFSAEYLSVPQKGAILDLFSGSGTVGIVCEKTDRRAYMMELDPGYCDVIVTRWQDFAGKQAIHEASGKTFDEMKAAKP
jgi:hypothetical protein